MAVPPDSLIAVGPNPAIDRVALIDGRPQGVSKATRFLETPGGKAIHVAMICSQLGGRAAVLTTAGGPNGRLLESLLEAEDLPATLVPTAAATRGTYAIVSRAEADLAEIHEPSGALSALECDRLVDELAGRASERSVVAVSGSLPAGSPEDLHARLVEAARAKGARVLLDCSTPAALTLALEAGPDLVAPNLHEARRLAGSDRTGPAEAGELSLLLEELTGRGAAAAWLTLGSEGSLISADGKVHRLTAPPPGPALNAIGCGDALLGGLAAGMIAGDTPLESAALGVAAATDKLTRLHPGRIDRASVESLKTRVAVEPFRAGVSR